jgi:hypothetical protein
VLSEVDGLYLFLHIRAFSSILALLISLCLKREVKVHQRKRDERLWQSKIKRKRRKKARGDALVRVQCTNVRISGGWLRSHK